MPKSVKPNQRNSDAHHQKMKDNCNSNTIEPMTIGRNSISRHRDSVSTNRSLSRSRSRSRSRSHSRQGSLSRAASVLNHYGPTHVDVNETEMFSGAASNVIPSSISSFHHHNHFRSPHLSSQSAQENGIDHLVLDHSDIDDNESHHVTFKNNEDLRLVHNESDIDLLEGYESEASDFLERSKFKFFKPQDIEAAKGVSSIARFTSNDDYHENTKVDYDTNWNSFADDYSINNYSVHTSNADRVSTADSHTKLYDNDESSDSYGSTEDNPYSEFFRGDAERALIENEEQELHIYEEDEQYEDMITKQEWEKTTKERESIKLHDKFFKKFPAINQSQRFYIAEEDLVVGIAGYQTTWIKLFIYNFICICTFGSFALLCRWIPKYRIKMMGHQVPLAKAEWLVIEDEFGSLEMPSVDRKWYNRNMSTYLPPKKMNDENVDNEGSEEIVDIKSSNTGASKAYTIDDVDPIVPILISFEYRYMKLFYDPIDDLFKLPNNWIDEKWCHYPDIKDGITETNYKLRKMIFGENVIGIKEKGITTLLIDEVLHPFYVFQIFSIFLWLADNYYYYAFCIFMISILSVTESLIETRSTMERMRDMSRFQCEVRVWRSGFWKEVTSDDLVPGDIYEISDPSLQVLPCDSILLTGDCIVNEAMLTGESVPVSKIAITPELVKELELEFNSTKFSSQFAKSYLYNGTKIIRVRYGQSDEDGGNEPATALVIRTGFNTTKGALIRSILFPKPVGFKFYEDSFKYIGFMTMIAGFGFIISTINFIKLGLGWDIIILRALDLITIVVPPALPATLTIGTNFALNRLKQKNIFCIAPMRVNVGGKLDVMCFDKTGTLTEEGLDIMGIHISSPKRDRKEHEFSELEKNIDIKNCEIPNAQKIFTAMLTCHSLKLINDIPVGDPLDENMFSFTKWNMIEDPSESVTLSKFINSRHLLTSSSPILFQNNEDDDFYVQLKEFEFISKLRRMSTICVKSSVNSIGETDKLEVFVKGAPEVIETICLPETIPENYNELLYHYTHNGFRIIACATKSLKHPKRIPATDLSFIGQLTRENVESDLEFIGFIVFENKLKESTTSTISQLHDAAIRTIMCTGDNILTAVSVGRECSIIKGSARVYIPTFDYECFEEQAEETSVEENVQAKGIPPIIWTEVDNPDMELDRTTLAPLGIHEDDNYCLAVTGDVFKYILTELDDKQDYLENILMRSSIFARMSPDEKHELVNQLQKLDYTVAFCGDGANDCGALKAADIGISLSEAEASVAAPFTSRIFEISCVLDVIKEGRASLVTSFSCFQYMSLYSAIQFISVSILYKEGSNLGDFQFLYIDLMLIIPIAIFMSWAKPYDKVVKKKPTANLISPKIIVSLVGNIMLIFIGQLAVWYWVKNAKYPWYIKPIPGNDDEVSSTDNTVLFFYSTFQYILVALMLTVGPPYREPVVNNIPFIMTIVGTIFVSLILMCIDVNSWFGNLMDLTWLSFEVKFGLFTGAIVNYVMLELSNKYVFSRLSRFVKRFTKRGGSNKRFKKLRKEFKKLV